MLDRSFKGMIKFKEDPKAKDIVRRYGYIVSPFETGASSDRLAYEIKALTGDGNKNDEVVRNNLVSLPGTRLKERHRDKLYGPDNPFTNNFRTINWKAGLNPGAFNLMTYNLRNYFNNQNHDERDVFRMAIDRAFSSEPYYDQPITVLSHRLMKEHAKRIRVKHINREIPKKA